MVIRTQTKVKPFLSWVETKYTFLPELLKRIPATYGTYHEPFLGSGALYFELNPERAVLSDINNELINTYRWVREDPEGIFRSVEKHINEVEYYSKIKAQSPFLMTSEDRAARFIYLNRTSKYLVYRENEYGEFDVPYGHLSRARSLELDNLNTISEMLFKEVYLHHFSFEMVKEYVHSGDFVYMDPPHQPAIGNATPDRFTFADQKIAASVFRDLDKLGCRVMLTNSDLLCIEELYRGYNIERAEIIKLVPEGTKFKPVVYSELIVRNYSNA